MVGESGRWYLRTIHMVRLPDSDVSDVSDVSDDNGDNADDPEAIRESYWSTLTFAVSP